MGFYPDLAEEARLHVEDLHALPHKLYVLSTGSTDRLMKVLWQVGGASGTILGSRFCYAQEDLNDALGHITVDNFCDKVTAMQMAAAAREKAREYAAKRGEPNVPVIGLGITSAVATKRRRRGEDRAHLAVATDDGIWHVNVNFGRGPDDEGEREVLREAQAQAIDMIALNMIFWATEIAQIPMPGYQIPMESRELEMGGTSWYVLPKIDEKVADGAMVSYDAEYRVVGNILDDQILPGEILFPGSFDPLHYGHVEMAGMIERMTGGTVIFQISNEHPVKGRIPEEDLLRRIRQFRYRWPVIVNEGGALYVDKAEIYPGVPMLIGADAVLELLNPEYYSDGHAEVKKALERFTELGTVFYVVGREVKGRGFMTRDDIPLPARYGYLFLDVSCRNDVSSTHIREAE